VGALLTEGEAALALKVCTKTLRAERKAGRLPYVTIRGAIRYTDEDLRNYIQEARQCHSNTEKARRSGNTILPSTVSDFAAALARREKASRKGRG
jgi:predicted site-specific integrase-resolvase